MQKDPSYLSNKALRYILAIDTYRSITKAAESLYISQPALTHYVHTLEHNLGCSFFTKSQAGMIPTSVGRRVIEYAKHISLLEDEMSKELMESLSSDAGELCFALPLLREANIVPLVIPPFKERYPKVNVRILETQSDHLLELLVNGSADVVLLNYIPVDNPYIKHTMIRAEKLLVALSPEHPLARKYRDDRLFFYPRIDLQELKDEPFILQNSNQQTRQISDRLFKKYGIDPKIYLEIRSIEASLRMAAQGCGVCFASETHVRTIPLLKKPALFCVDTSGATMYLVLAYLKNRFQPRYFQDFITIVRDLLASPSPA
ncbi:MAG: LysR family transcriptional regulator [Bacillota bacterium]